MLKKIYAWLYKKTSRTDEAGEYSGGFVQGAIRQRVLDLCRGMTGKVLEIGVGSGLFIMKFAVENPGAQIVGIDLDEARLDATWEKIESKGISNIKLFRQDATSMTFGDNSIDAIVCINFFLDINIDTTIKILREMKRVVKTGGRIIFEFRNSHNLLFRLKYALAKYYDPTCPYPLYTYNPKRIDAIIDELRLNVVGRTHIGFPIKKYAPIILIEAEKQ